MKNFLKILSWGGGNSLKPSSSACFEQYSSVKLGARKGAFTLAEVLITLGIIGVVAALTLPSLIQKYQDQVLENQLKKMYSTLSQGMQKAMADDGVSNFYDTELFQACRMASSDACTQMVKKYFNVVAVKTDGREYYDNVIQCKNIDGKEVCSRDKSKRRLYWYLGRYETRNRYVLGDGSEFTFSAHAYIGKTVEYYSVYIDIDTNGEKGPNTEGLDTFGLYVDKNSRFGGRDWFVEEIQKNNWKFPW